MSTENRRIPIERMKNGKMRERDEEIQIEKKEGLLHCRRRRNDKNFRLENILVNNFLSSFQRATFIGIQIFS